MNAGRLLRRADQLALDVIYPVGFFCVACGEAAHGGTLCPDCAAGLEEDRLPEPRCPVCGHPLRPGEDCAFCAGGAMEAVAPFVHGGIARRLVHRLKFDQIAVAAEPLASAMAEEVRQRGLPSPARVTWVSTTPQHLRERGVDHARLLAEALAVRLELPADRLLDRVNTSDMTRQLGAGRAERLRNLEGTFACTVPLSGTVLLVDDVLTTGATARTAAQALRAAGAERVLVVTATQTAVVAG